MIKKKILFVIFSFFIALNFSFAKDLQKVKDGVIVEEDGKKVFYKKKNVVDFSDALIEGEIKNPNDFYFVHRPQTKFDSLIKKRPNFHKEMLRDSLMIR
jgi:hypothetical protein